MPEEQRDGGIELSRISTRTTTGMGAQTPTSEGHDLLTRTTRDGMATPDSTYKSSEAPAEGFESYPDGGLAAWIQIACCFVLFFTSVGTIYSWGVFQDALEEKQVASSSTLAFIGSTQATFQAIFAIPIRRIVAAYGPRNVALVGGALAGIGPILASFASNSVPGLLFLQAFFFGTGQALMFYCIATLPSTYFNRRRNLATGICYSAGGFGGAIVSLMTSRLITKLDVPWALRILGLTFLTLNLPAAWMLKSRTPRVPWTRKQDKDKKTADDDDQATAAQFVDWRLFKDIRFSLFFIAAAIVVFPLFVPAFFIPVFARSSLGLSSGAAAAVLAGFNVASAVGRIAFGIGADVYLGSVNALFICLAGFAVSTLLIWPFATSIVPLALFAVLSGLTAGGFFSLIPGVLATLFGTKTLAVAFPMVVTAFTPGYLLGSPTAGYLLEAVGGPSQGFSAFRPAIFYAGSLSFVSAVLMGLVRFKEGGSWRRKV
ncbi:hypothetical protein OIV83_004462 [Microbotryomycetes sp. JL201]|nr:hypothetical protein OIV83_004462 [Microbotryomycetes sp. JL201]